MTEFETAILDFDEEQEIAFEPLPDALGTQRYLEDVRRLPPPSDEQLKAFVGFVANAKSWYKHLPALPPGKSLQFYLNVDAGRDRLRRYGGEVIHRDRTSNTRQLHYTWMSTEDYRQRFGYLAFCCRAGTEFYSDEPLEDGVATLDPNFSHPFIEGAPGELALVPASVLTAGTCLVTRTVHDQTDALSLARNWNRERKSQAEPIPDGSPTPYGERWCQIGALCEKIGAAAALVRKRTGIFTGLRNLQPSMRIDRHNRDLHALIVAQRGHDRSVMSAAIESMLQYIYRAKIHLH